MKRLFFITIIALFASASLFAQATSVGDTLIIGPLNSDGEPFGALNEYIMGDTTETGERIHSVYKLLRGQQYLVTATIVISDPIVLMADDGPERPPIIRTGLKEDGTTLDPIFSFQADLKAKNIWFSGINPTGDGPSSWRILEEINSGGRFEWENCIFENPWSWWTFMSNWGSHDTHIFKDCIIRNNQSKNASWTGQLQWPALADTIKFINCTIFNVGVNQDCNEDMGILYNEYDHCTFVNTVVHQFVLNKPVIAKITNNIFVNCYAFSGGPAEIAAHPDKEIHGIIHMYQFDPFILDSVWGDKYDPNGDGVLTEDERVYELKNNVWYYTEPIVDYWNAFDTVATQTWYNNAVREFFVNNLEEKEVTIVGGASDGSDTTWIYAPHPFFVEENTMNEDPGFTNIGNSDVRLAQNLTSMREGTGGVAWLYNGDGLDPEDGNTWLTFPWPLPEDLTYSNQNLLTAAQGGFPVGDLNWYPEKKAQWEQWVNGIEEDNNDVIPTKYSLSQNYPNPFNPSTVIEFSIPVKNKVTLDVYNALGQRVATLVNKNLDAGKYKFNFDASPYASGVYFYRLKAGKFLQIRKMIFMK